MCKVSARVITGGLRCVIQGRGAQRGDSVHLVGPASSPIGQQVEQTLVRVMLQKSELMFVAPVIVCV